MDPRRSNGNFADLGSHMVDLARLFFGDPQTVTSDLGAAVDRSGVAGLEGPLVHDNARVFLGYLIGPSVLIETSCITPMGDRFMSHVLRLETSTASVALDYHFGGAEVGLHLSITEGDGPYRPLSVPPSYYGNSNPADFMDIYAKESFGARFFVDCVLEGRAAQPDFTDGAKVQEIVDAALRSSAERRTIDLA